MRSKEFWTWSQSVCDTFLQGFSWGAILQGKHMTAGLNTYTPVTCSAIKSFNTVFNNSAVKYFNTGLLLVLGYLDTS